MPNLIYNARTSLDFRMIKRGFGRGWESSMRWSRQWGWGMAAIIGLCAIAPSSVSARAAEKDGVTALARIQRGMWELRERGSNAQPRRICLSDPNVLVQLRHSGQACSRYILDNKADRATFHYSCAAAGNGRTTIRMETPRLVQIETQGILNGSPFESRFEGRFTGPCRR